MSEETKIPQNTEVEETERVGIGPTLKFESLQFNVTINNRFSEELKVVSQSTKIFWGKFVDGPYNVPKKQSKIVFQAWGRDSSPSGTEGTVKYQVGDAQNIFFEIHWNVPLSGSSSMNINKNGVKVSPEGWNGTRWSENVLLIVGPD